MIKWKTQEDYTTATVGHLHVEIFSDGPYGESGTDNYEPENHNWAVCPDDEDKCDERAFANGSAKTLDKAKDQVIGAIRKMVAKITDTIEP